LHCKAFFILAKVYAFVVEEGICMMFGCGIPDLYEKRYCITAKINFTF